MRELALVDTSHVSRDVMDRILQSLVFFGDVVSIRASFTTSPGSAGRDLQSTIAELQEMGLIKLWAHEYEIDDGGRLRQPPAGGQITERVVDLVTNREFLAEQIAELDETLRENRARAYAEGEDRQGVGEIIALRQTLTASMVSSSLGQNGLMLARQTGPSRLPEFRQTFHEQVVEDVIEALSIGPLYALSPADIAHCRGYTSGFKDLLEKSAIAAVASAASDGVTPADVAREMVAAYENVMQHAQERSIVNEVASEVAWDIAAALLPPSVGMKYIAKAVHWHRQVKGESPFLLLNQLRIASQKRTAR